MLTRVFYSLLLVCLCHFGYSQSDYPIFSIGANVANLGHARTPAIAGIAEVRVSETMAIRFDGGSMINTIHKNDLHVNSFTGYQYGIGARAFVYNKEPDEVYSLFVEGRIKNKNYKANMKADFAVTSDYGMFFMRDNYTADITEYNFQVGFGQKIQFEGFRFDVIVGLGPTHVDIDYTLPADTEFDTNGTNLWAPNRDYDVYPNHLIFVELVLGYTFGL